jgi:hypothetical protein
MRWYGMTTCSAYPERLSSHQDTITMNENLTMTVPQAGKTYFDLCRAASYAAAARGELPTIRIGRLLRVPVRAMEQMLDDATVKPGAAA